MSEIPEATEARDPETPADRLEQLADLYPELYALIVMNPSCPPDLRQWIIEDRGSKEAAEAWSRHQARQAATQTIPVQPHQTQQMPPVPMRASPQGGQQAPARANSRANSSCGGMALGCLVISVIVMTLMYGCIHAIDKFGSSSSGSDASATPDKKSPAPAGAITTDLFQTPSKNIACEVADGQVNCFVNERFYAENGQQDCDETLFALSVGQGDAAVACGLIFAGHEGEELQTLEYGTTGVSSDGNYACSSSEEGVRCWNQWTGKGFTVNRSSYEFF